MFIKSRWGSVILAQPLLYYREDLRSTPHHCVFFMQLGTSTNLNVYPIWQMTISFEKKINDTLIYRKSISYMANDNFF
jgi:hypothetical protein